MPKKGRLIIPQPTTTPDLDILIVELLKETKEKLVPQETIYYLCTNIRRIFLSQPVELILQTPITIVGDLHGQFTDLVRIFQRNGIPPDQQYLFLGDYVDRGKSGVEILCLLFALKLKYPDNIYLIRGNHECAALNRIYGFHDECLRKYGHLAVWNAFVSTFNVLPFSAVIDSKILCIHGGISPKLLQLSQLTKINRPVDIPEEGLITDVLWADPILEENGFGPNERGTGCYFGLDVLCNFLNENGLQLLIRAHEMVDGFAVLNGCCITLFSAPFYCGTVTNSGAYLTIDQNLAISFYKFGTESI
ncbi:serine/threonine protein phosphatase PP1-2, putative [Entamoeba invadens IP1]|uniref:Serine/threonine-protein phosphatase n=1 Tax=Entamoeba invadens IP1 TaxID=370355 RepID=A0A0A1TY90_ENTIV|nr:serine/threonine protein phosphatase PP1-2, putative [Entamoeba invadens IP1]ELP86455.1 serine/threonine protein phosphatase PP1-2, putative [Entamoeba invadens IP1]|eukprot:XP_004185801.1 serine/threonine protein phosphatase PP1-2, putative [Entamoeba invadens IP1]